MEDILYLDTARVGRPTHRTLQAGTDSLMLAAHEGGSALFDRFLRSGFADCPAWMSARYPGLRTWGGIAALKENLRRLVGGPAGFPVLLSNRSAQLMQLAARLFFLRCRNVLTCDLGWPAYQDILERTTTQSEVKVTVVPLREMAFEGRATAHDVIDSVVQAYVKNRCDGLFLPAVSNLGVRLPIEQIVRRIEAKYEVRLVVIDGAQEFSHIGANLVADYCDLYLAGCHKWLAGHHPMGVGFFGRDRSRGLITTMMNQMLAANILDDPLLRYTHRIEGGHRDNYTETVNLASLFTCEAAVAEQLELEQQSVTALTRAKNRTVVADLIANTDWATKQVSPEMQTGILLAQAKSSTKRKTDPGQIRDLFRNNGVGLTTYADGYLRISMPNTAISQCDTHRLQAAFKEQAG